MFTGSVYREWDFASFCLFAFYMGWHSLLNLQGVALLAKFLQGVALLVKFLQGVALLVKFTGSGTPGLGCAGLRWAALCWAGLGRQADRQPVKQATR